MLMPRRRLHGNLRGSMCSTRFVRGIRYYNVFYTSSRRLDPRKFAERAQPARIKLNFQVFVILIEVCRRRVCRSMTCSLKTLPRSTRGITGEDDRTRGISRVDFINGRVIRLAALVCIPRKAAGRLLAQHARGKTRMGKPSLRAYVRL